MPPESALARDAHTGIWGIPVPRRGDPDRAPDNLGHSPADSTAPDRPLVLPARLFAPDGQLDRSRPCILVANGYGVSDAAPENGRSARSTLLSELVSAGYTGLLVALRQASSDPQALQVGRNDYYRNYGEDGVAILNEMVRRLGCGMTGNRPETARIGMVGASLVGGSQWAVVKQPDWPAALRAIAPDSAGMNHLSWSTLWYPGGILPGPLRASRPGREFGHIFPHHRELDGFWLDRQLTSGELQSAATRGLALLMTGGWDEYNTPGNLSAYLAFMGLDGKARRRLVIAPTGHTMPPELYRPLARAWMDRWLKDSVGPEQPEVLIWVRGAERWRAESAWPPADARRVSVALSGNGLVASGARVTPLADLRPDQGSLPSGHAEPIRS